VSAKTRRGCFPWSCLTAILVSLIGVFVVGLASFWYVSVQVRQYTTDTPAKLPTPLYTDHEIAALEDRLQQIDLGEASPTTVPRATSPADFKPAETGQVPPTGEVVELVLSARDLNALISRQPDLQGKLLVTIEDGQVGGEVSIPLETLPGGEGRFLNAHVSLAVELRDQELFVAITNATVKGAPLPKILLAALGNENLAAELNQHPMIKSRLQQLDSLTVEDDSIVLRKRVLSPSEL